MQKSLWPDITHLLGCQTLWGLLTILNMIFDKMKIKKTNLQVKGWLIFYKKFKCFIIYNFSFQKYWSSMQLSIVIAQLKTKTCQHESYFWSCQLPSSISDYYDPYDYYDDSNAILHTSTSNVFMLAMFAGFQCLEFGLFSIVVNALVTSLLAFLCRM